MKTIIFFLFSLLTTSVLYSQNSRGASQLLSSKNKPNSHHLTIQNHIHSGFQSGYKEIMPRDSLLYKHVHLSKDDPAFNKRSRLWAPTVGVLAFNIGLNLFDTYALNKSYTKVGFNSWGSNIKHAWPVGNNGWIWGQDNTYITNFVGHPYAGAMYFNAARSNGYNYYQSLPFAFEGAYWWKIFGENGKPEKEDLINTPLSGALFGEILFRLSSNILDDRTRGADRVFREIAAGIIDPMRGINRLFQGKSYRHTTEEVYQKEPMNITLYGGVHKINNDTRFGSGPTSEMLAVFIDYGNPFEQMKRKPFDYFRFNLELGNGWGRRILNKIEANGLLVGKNAHFGKMEMLGGAFQQFDYIKNSSMEITTMGFGAGFISKMELEPKYDIFAHIIVYGVPLGANNTFNGIDSTFGGYNFIYGLQAKGEFAFEFNHRLKFTLKGDYYWTHTYKGRPELTEVGRNQILVINPKVSVRLFKEFYIGLEHVAFYGDRKPDPINSQGGVIRTEQKFFIQYCFGNFIHGI